MQDEEDGIEWWHDEELDNWPVGHIVQLDPNAHRGHSIIDEDTDMSHQSEDSEDTVQYIRSVAPVTSARTFRKRFLHNGSCLKSRKQLKDIYIVALGLMKFNRRE